MPGSEYGPKFLSVIALSHNRLSEMVVSRRISSILILTTGSPSLSTVKTGIPRMFY